MSHPTTTNPSSTIISRNNEAVGRKIFLYIAQQILNNTSFPEDCQTRHIQMHYFNWTIIFLISSLSLSRRVGSDDSNLLPQSVVKLKQYYDVIKNLEKRGIISTDIATKEKHLYIEQASKLVGRQPLLTEQEFLTWHQRQLIISFSNIIAILAGIIVIVALVVFIGMFAVPLLIQIPLIVWETLFCLVSFYLMMFTHNSWLVFVGCLAFIATLSSIVKLHFSEGVHNNLIACWTCFLVLSIVAIYQQCQEAGYLAIMVLEASLGFVVFAGELILVIGFRDEKVIPSATIASFVLILLGSILYIQQRSNLLTVPFTRPLLFLGTFVYFIGILILSSRLYTDPKTNKLLFWLLQLLGFVSGLAAMLFGPMLDLPFVQAIGGTMFVIWLLEKYVEITSWKNTLSVIGSLFGFGLLLYGFAYFLKYNPEYFIFLS